MATTTLLLSNAVTELQNALQQAFSTFKDSQYDEEANTNFYSGSSTRRSLIGSSIYERKRALRRVDRAVTSLQSSCTNEELQNDEDVILDDTVVNCLIEILTDLPQILFLNSENQDSRHHEENPSSTNNTIESLYANTSKTTCHILQQHSKFPLDSNRVDGLLDQIAALALKERIDLGLLELINTSLFAHDACIANSDVEEDHFPPPGNIEHQDKENRQRNNDYDAKTQNDLFFLDGKEAMALTQLLIKISLDHFSSSWVFATGGENYDDKKMEAQEASIQLRVLLGYLLRYLSCTLQGVHPCSITDGKLISDDTEMRETEISMQRKREPFGNGLEQAIYNLCSGKHTNSDTLDDYQNMKEDTHNQAAVEDFMDLLTCFWIENVEYALDVIDSASSSLRQITVTTTSTTNISSAALVQYNMKKSENSSLSSPMPQDVYQYLNDVIRHTSLAVGMVELLREDLGLGDSSSTLSRINSVEKLWVSFAEFVALYCSNEAIKITSDNKSDGDLFSTADSVLFRLYKASLVVPASGVEGEGWPGKRSERQEQRTSGRDMAMTITLLRAFPSSFSDQSFAAKRNVEEDHDNLFENLLENTSRHCYHARKRFRSDGKGSEDMIDNENKDNNLDDDPDLGATVPGGKEAQSSRMINIIQACVLSNLTIPKPYIVNDHQSSTESAGNTNERREEKNTLSRLVQTLISDDRQNYSKEQNFTTPSISSVTDPLNPWHAILARKLSDTMLSKSHNNNTKTPTAITVSVASSISDISSTPTAKSTDSNDYLNTRKRDASPHHIAPFDKEQSLRKYVKAVEPYINTL